MSPELATAAALSHPSSRLPTESDESTRGRLTAVDWSFTKRPKAGAIEGIHPYPAKFIGELPRTLIARLPIRPGDAVFDPFCGSGSTLVEAQRAGIPSIGIDLNPIACLIARVKTTPLPSEFGDAVVRVVREAQAIKSIAKPDIPNVDHWFKQDIQLAVGALAQRINCPEYLLWYDQLRLALSGILVRVSNQDSDTRYAAVTKDVDRDGVFSAFIASASKIQRALLSRDWTLIPAKVIEADTLEVTAEQVGHKVGVVVTSPPYPNAYEYWLYHKYRMWWLGFDPLAVKEREIGARAHFFKKNRHTADEFVAQMRPVLALVNKVLTPNGFACFIVGRSKIHGEYVDNGDIIRKIAESTGLTMFARFERPISAHRKSFNLSHANIKTESVLVFQRT